MCRSSCVEPQLFRQTAIKSGARSKGASKVVKIGIRERDDACFLCWEAQPDVLLPCFAIKWAR